MEPIEALSPDAELRRLRWQCRRGMLELDLLLGDFLDQGYARLSSAEREDFARLLGCQDQQLHHWLIGETEPTESAPRALVRRIRQIRRELRTSATATNPNEGRS